MISTLSAPDPLAAALRLLTVRDRSSAELAGALERKGYTAAEITQVIERCIELNYLDDRRYALQRAQSLLRSGRAAGPLIMADLRRRGIDKELAAAALAAAQAQLSPEQVLRGLLQRRYPGFDFQRADAKEKRRVLAFFQRRGFAPEQIFAILKEEKDS